MNKSAKNQIYAYAKLPRSGLCNQLFVWAKAEVFALEHNARLIKPQFFKLKLGPIIRGEKDWRFYHNLFDFDERKYIADTQKAYLLATLPKREILDLTAPQQNVGAVLYVCKRLDGHFRGLNEHQPEIFESLVRIIRPRWIDAAEQIAAPFVGMHVRFGDFSASVRHPNWYIQSVDFVRSIVPMAPITLFSDAREEELTDLTNIPGVNLAQTGSAISDLYALARSKFLIATGNSPFSAWAAFLGQMPAMTRLGNPFSWWELENCKKLFIGEWNPSNPDSRLIATLKELS